ncbi:class I SAM-dependent methyltransferase [Jatrophihabitans fulvus]
MGLLGDAVREAGGDPARLRALDFGAGNGMVGEELRRLGVAAVVGCDLLPEAREAALRDRPGVYDDYVAVDIVDPPEPAATTLRSAGFDTLTCVAALGFDDIPPAAFAAAFNLVGETGWVAFNLRDRYWDTPTDFGRLLDRMVEAGLLETVSKTRYVHRRSVAGTPLEYFAVVARKHGHIPSDWI